MKSLIGIFKNPFALGATLGAGMIASFAMLPHAWGDLVYDDAAPAVSAPAAPATPDQNARAEDRAAIRQALSASEKARDTVQVQSAPAVVAAPALAAPTVTQVQVQAQQADASSGDVQNLSKSELMRRERVREELKNEDLLQERLEELRLRDERRRTDEVMRGQAVDGTMTDTITKSAAAPVQVKDEAVVAPITDHPGVVEAAPAAAAAPAPIAAAPVAAPAEARTELVLPSDASSDKTIFSVAPRAGISNMAGNDYFNINPHYAAGVGISMGASEYIALEIGYTYSEYGVAMNSTNPFVQQIVAMQNYYGTGGANFDTVTMKQNVFDAGLKLYLLGRDSKIRPYVGVGGAYALSYINYSSQVLQAAQTYAPNMGLGNDYDMNQFLGYASAGLEVKISRNLSVGAGLRYYTVLSSSENSQLTPLAFGYNPGYYGAYGGGYYGNSMASYGTAAANTDKSLVGGSLADQSFYSALATFTFTF